MFPNPVVLNDGAVNHSYGLRGITDTGSLYVDAASPLDQQSTFKISHQTTSKGKPEELRRSVYRLDEIVENTLGNQGTLSGYIVLSIPTKVATAEQVTKLISKLAEVFVVQETGSLMLAADI